jgi:hypothetical protein
LTPVPLLTLVTKAGLESSLGVPQDDKKTRNTMSDSLFIEFKFNLGKIITDVSIQVVSQRSIGANLAIFW